MQFYRFAPDPDKGRAGLLLKIVKTGFPTNTRGYSVSVFSMAKGAITILPQTVYRVFLSTRIYRGKGNWLKTWITWSGDKSRNYGDKNLCV